MYVCFLSVNLGLVVAVVCMPDRTARADEKGRSRYRNPACLPACQCSIVDVRRRRLSFCRFIVIILDLCSCSSSSITNHESQGFTTVSQNVTKLEQVLTEMKSDSTGRSRPSSLLSYLSSHNSFIVYFVKHAPDTCCFALVKWTMSSRLKYIYHEVTPRLQKPPGPTFPA